MERVARKVFRNLAIRVGLYALLLGCGTVLMHQGANWPYERSFYGENGLIEWMQVLFLLVSIAVLWRAASLAKDRRAVLFAMICLLAATIMREWDNILDETFGRHVWKILSGTFIVAATIPFFLHRREFYISALHLTRQPSFGIMLTGGLIVLVFSRLFGSGDFWSELIDHREFARTAKKVAEECTELMGYFFIMTGTFEHFHETRMRKRVRTGIRGLSVKSSI
jgi:hypothetical protein